MAATSAHRLASGAVRPFPGLDRSTKTPTIRLAVFDLDDTLFLEREFVRSGLEAVAVRVRRRLGLSGFFDPAWELFTSGRHELLINRTLERLGAEPRPALIQSLVRCYRAHAPRIQLRPDARRFLKQRPGGVEVAIITDGRPATQRSKVRALGLEDLAASVVYSGRWGPRYAKPHRRAFRIVQKRFDMDPAACLYVGDNPAKDFRGPIGLGWSVCRIRRPGGLFESAELRGVPEIRSLDELSMKFTFSS